MKKSIAMEWVAALRSGEYKQARGSLQQNDGYCCLGVLCEVVGVEIKDTAVILPDEAKAKAGMQTCSGRLTHSNSSLASLNDTGTDGDRMPLTFDEIADIIQLLYKEL
jgi:hypothetical protein